MKSKCTRVVKAALFGLGIFLLLPIIGKAEPWMGGLAIRDDMVWPNSRPGNYGTVHYFLDEDRNEQIPFDVLVQVHADGRPPSELQVELFTNLNRRDHAKVWENVNACGGRRQLLYDLPDDPCWAHGQQ